jgi:hypothetical protein
VAEEQPLVCLAGCILARSVKKNFNLSERTLVLRSPPGPSDAPTTETVAQAINRAIRRLGVRGCVARMAQEFGDHPGAAATRMCWAHRLASRPEASMPGDHDAVTGRETA